MSDRVSQTILLCEDELQSKLVCAYLKKCGRSTQARSLLKKIASLARRGGGEQWVRQEFPTELRACRKRQAKTVLIVVVDADHFTIEERQGHLKAGCDDPPVADDDPLVVLVPKRHVETWIRAATGEQVTEIQDCKFPKHMKPEVDAAAREIHKWARNNAQPGATCVESLLAALPEWRKIG